MSYTILAEGGWNKQVVSADSLRDIRNFIISTKYSPDQPIDVDRIRARILRTSGVESIQRLEVRPLVGEVGDFVYSNYSWYAPKQEGKIIPPPGGIFEMLSSRENIKVTVI